MAIKLGAAGCFVKEDGKQPLRIPGSKVPVVDTTGAGDAFDAGFIYGIVKGWDLEKSS